jgi:hypothetical protein
MRAWRLLLLLLPLLFYAALPTFNFYWDGVAFAINIEKQMPAAALAHPNHLAYAMFGSQLYQWVNAMGMQCRALFAMQAANGVLAGLCVIVFHICLRLRNLPADVTIPAALLFGFSATWWRFATDANPYVPSIFFLLCAWALIERRKGAAPPGLATAGAMLFHQLAILFLPFALLRLRGRPRAMAVYLATAIIPVTAAYLSAYLAVTAEPSIPGLLSWMTSHSTDSEFSLRPIANSAFTIRGTFRLFFGGKLSDFVDNGWSWAILAGFAIASAAWLAFLYRAARAGGGRISGLPRDLLVWTACFAGFLFFWMPQNTFYRLFYLPPLIGVLASMAAPAPGARIASWLFLPVLFLWNFAFMAFPQSRPDYNAPLRFARAQQDIWAPGTPIIFHRFHPDLWTISYFNMQASWISMERADIGQLERSLEYARSEKRQLWLEATAYELVMADPMGKRWLTRHQRPGMLLEFRDDKHHFHFHGVD